MPRQHPLTVPEVARLLGITTSGVHKLIDRGRLVAHWTAGTRGREARMWLRDVQAYQQRRRGRGRPRKVEAEP